VLGFGHCRITCGLGRVERLCEWRHPAAAEPPPAGQRRLFFVPAASKVGPPAQVVSYRRSLGYVARTSAVKDTPVGSSMTALKCYSDLSYANPISVCATVLHGHTRAMDSCGCREIVCRRDIVMLATSAYLQGTVDDLASSPVLTMR